ncbi:MAG: protein kinase, partial [Deltaproteobacteria bacterium]|nr:protein kinase [Deltaproteobacteria bacterium]
METGSFRPGEMCDRYKIVRLIAAGGAGEVYEAVHEFTGRTVALKCLQLGLAQRDDLRERMRLEAVVLCKIRHPNVVAVHDAGLADDGTVWIAMELLVGRTLRELLPAGALSIPAALYYAAGIADGVNAAHELNVVHRDLKPENVFITERNEVKVLDLGTAKFHGYGMKTTDKMRTIGTPAYMSPEHLRGNAVDARADVYALGVITYEMLAGSHPYAAALRDPYELGAQHLFAEPPPLPALVPGFPDPIWQIVRKAISKPAKDRHATMGEFAAQVRAARADFVRETEPPALRARQTAAQSQRRFTPPEPPAPTPVSPRAASAPATAAQVPGAAAMPSHPPPGANAGASYPAPGANAGALYPAPGAAAMPSHPPPGAAAVPSYPPPGAAAAASYPAPSAAAMPSHPPPGAAAVASYPAPSATAMPSHPPPGAAAVASYPAPSATAMPSHPPPGAAAVPSYPAPGAAAAPSSQPSAGGVNPAYSPPGTSATPAYPQAATPACPAAAAPGYSHAVSPADSHAVSPGYSPAAPPAYSPGASPQRTQAITMRLATVPDGSEGSPKPGPAVDVSQETTTVPEVRAASIPTPIASSLLSAPTTEQPSLGDTSSQPASALPTAPAYSVAPSYSSAVSAQPYAEVAPTPAQSAVPPYSSISSSAPGASHPAAAPTPPNSAWAPSPSSSAVAPTPPFSPAAQNLSPSSGAPTPPFSPAAPAPSFSAVAPRPPQSAAAQNQSLSSVAPTPPFSPAAP